MERLPSDLQAFYERRATSLLTLVLNCSDPKTHPDGIGLYG
jgi:hypothetical protein